MSHHIYRSDPEAASDTDFEPGRPHHLVVGNKARLLDARRTPVEVTAVVPDTGAFEVEVGAFEDAGTRWELPLKDVGRFQFAKGGLVATGASLATIERAAAAFDRELSVAADPETREITWRRIASEREALRGRISEIVGQLDVDQAVRRREGDERLFAVLDDYLATRGLVVLDQRFASAFVSNPRSGEIVKGHAIVLAELGLAPYRGQVVRGRDVFAGAFSKTLRAEHLVARLAFTQELWSALGRESVVLYRGTASDGDLGKPPSASLMSATFSREVATEHFEGGPSTKTAVLWRQVVPANRLLMTFLETAEMNRRFKEAEAVLLGDPSNSAF